MDSNDSDLSPATADRHDVKQPLNVICMVIGCLRARTLPLLTGADAAYLADKLEKIELQIERANALLDRLPLPRD